MRIFYKYIFIIVSAVLVMQLAYGQIKIVGNFMKTKNVAEEKLFAYGTLLHESIQLSIFGVKLKGVPDVLIGYKLSQLKIKDPMAANGEAVYPIIIFTANKNDEVQGKIFELTAKQLQQADEYEVPDYKRISVTLKSGIKTWVYVGH